MEILLNSAVDDFLVDCKIYKSPATYKFYYEHFNVLKKVFVNYHLRYLSDINQSFFTRFIMDCRVNNISNSTINKRLVCLKLMLRFNNYDVDSLHVKSLRKNTIHYPCLTPFEYHVFLKYVYSIGDIVRKCVFLLFIDSGIRLNELRNVKIENIDFNNNRILLDVTKTSQSRYVYFQESTKFVLLRCIQLFNLSSGLIFNFKGRTISAWFEVASTVCGFRVTSHILRHTFATRLVQNNVEVFSLQKLMGHADVSTTMIYVTENNDHIKNEYFRCSKKY